MQATDNFSNVVPVDFVEHPQEKPFCFDSACPCHEDDIEIARVALFIEDGLMTPEEATDFVGGKGI
jgi:hypothetical protein